MFLIKTTVLLNASVYNLQQSCYREGEFFPEHCHEFHEFFLVVSGTLEHILNGTRTLLPEGTLQLIHPGDHHLLRCAKGCPEVRIFNCNVHSEEIVKVLSFLSGGHEFSLDDCVQRVHLPPHSAAWNYLTGLAEKGFEKTGNPLLRDSILRHLTGAVFLTLMLRSGHSSTETPQWLADSCEAMKRKENYVEGLPCFLRLAARSQEHLCRSMKRFYGISPQEYILELRLDEAVRLLLNSEMEISAIACEVGFRNLSYFRRCFRKRFYVSPGIYKKMRKSRCGNPSAALKGKTFSFSGLRRKTEF